MIETMEEIRLYIRRRLGGSKLCIELTDSDLDTAVTDALDMLTRYYPGDAYDAVAATADVKRYVVNKRRLIGVTEVQFLNPNQASDRISENPFQTYNLSQGLVEGLIDNMGSEMYLQLGYVKDLRRVMSSDPVWEAMWEYNSTTRKREYVIYIDISNDGIPYEVSYRYVHGYEASDDREVGLPAVRITFAEWVKKYAVACAREVLGDVRNKFQGIPLPDGGNAETDGSTQIDRAREEKDKLVEDLVSRQRQLAIVVG